MSNIKVINVDWIKLFGYFSAGEPDYSSLALYGYRVEFQSRGTKQFRRWDKVIEVSSGLMVFELCHTPYSVKGKDQGGIYKPSAATLRVDNRVCYCSKVFELIQLWAGLVGFNCTSVSRLDIAADFHLFDNGMKPENLIRKYYTGEYLKHGYTKSLGFGVQYNDYMPETLSFKGKNSAVGVKLYDKTKELMQTHDKPYIQSTWRAGGLVAEKRIWRLEVSLSADAKRLVSMETGELFELDLSYISNYGKMQELFYSMVSHYFKWYVRVIGKKKTRCPVLKLFNSEEIGADIRRHYLSPVNGIARKHRRINSVLKEAYRASKGDWEALGVIDKMYSILFDNYENIFEAGETEVIVEKDSEGRHKVRERLKSCWNGIDENLLDSIETKRIND